MTNELEGDEVLNTLYYTCSAFTLKQSYEVERAGPTRNLLPVSWETESPVQNSPAISDLANR